MDDRAQVKWLGGTEWDVSDHIYIEDGRLPAVFSKDLLTNGNHIFVGKIQAWCTSIYMVIVRDLPWNNGVYCLGVVSYSWHLLIGTGDLFLHKMISSFLKGTGIYNVSPFWSLYYTQTMHYYKRNHPKWPHICCLFDPPQMGNLVIPWLTKWCTLFKLSFSVIFQGDIKYRHISEGFSTFLVQNILKQDGQMPGTRCLAG